MLDFNRITANRLKTMIKKSTEYYISGGKTLWWAYAAS
jgi:hypothetical protein